MAGHEFKERIVLASAMVQCILHGFYTLMFIACAMFMAILKPANAWTLLAINAFTYVTVTAASVFDVVVVVVGATDEDDNTLGYPLNLLIIRLSLGMITSVFVQSLVVWRFLRLWNRMTHVAAGAWFVVFCITTYGFITVYWRESGPLDYMYGIYRKLRFSFMAALGGLIAGRTYWMSRKLKTLQGPNFRTRAYTWLGAFVDGGFLYTIFLLIDLNLRIQIIRCLLPQMAGLVSTCILYQETVGKASQDIEVMTCETVDRTNTTPVLDTIFSTPVMSTQAGATQPRMSGSALSFIDSEYNYDSRGGDRDSGLLGTDLQVGDKNRKSRSAISVVTRRPE